MEVSKSDKEKLCKVRLATKFAEQALRELASAENPLLAEVISGELAAQIRFLRKIDRILSLV